MKAHIPKTKMELPEQAYTLALIQLNILRHSIGYDDAGNDRFPGARSDDERRNRFVTDATGKDGLICRVLVDMGFMVDHGPQSLAGGMNYFTVTDLGKAVVLLHKPVPRKLTRSQARYQEYLQADSGMTFIEFIKACAHHKRYGDDKSEMMARGGLSA